MALVLHILIALASVGYTTYVFFRPTHNRLKGTYTLVILTLATGTYLIAQNPAHMVQACTTGLFYVSAVSCGIIAAHNKLVAETKNKKDT
jgi:hypothetical protein